MRVRTQTVRIIGLSLLVANLNATAQDPASNSRPAKPAPVIVTTCKQVDVDRLIARARKGDAGAQFWTGVAFEQGWCGKADLGKAFHWYKLSAAQGDPGAQNSLGQMYENGRGVKQDYALAANWYRRAAEHVPNLGGAGQGRSNFGLLYMEGFGVPQDLVLAYMWFQLAGSEMNLAQARARMTQPEIRQAEQLAEDWIKITSGPVNRHRVCHLACSCSPPVSAPPLC